MKTKIFEVVFIVVNFCIYFINVSELLGIPLL